MAGRSVNSLGGRGKDWKAGSPVTRFSASGKAREFYTFDNAPGNGAYATGGTVFDGGDGYIYHIFTAGGNFTVTRPSAAIDSVNYLIVAGGGGTIEAPTYAGGGGGGGLLYGSVSVNNTPGVYTISVGAGGPNVPGTPGTPRNGSPSSAFGVTATGGGGGGGANPGPPGSSPLTTGGSGGSGGGGGGSIYPANNGGPGGIATPTTIPRQGYNGSPGGPGGPSALGGAGGGAGGPGGTGNNFGPGKIIPEFPADIVGRAIPAANYTYWYSLVAAGGYSAGGRSFTPATPARIAIANSGYGGQSVVPAPTSATGGSGIVCIRYRKPAPYSRATGGTIEPSTHPEHPGVWRHIFSAPGTFTITDPSLQFVEYLAVGGGGGGGSAPGAIRATGGGGGAGGFVTSIDTSITTPLSVPEAYLWNPGSSVRVGKQMPVSVTAYPVSVGTGGPSDSSGSNTTIGLPGPLQIIAYGGGAGTSSAATPGGSGGSGGGVGKPFSNTAGTGGAASPSPLIQGNSGGSFSGFPTNPSTGSGGGGAGASGGNGPGTSTESGLNNPPVGGGIGGAGWYSVLSPSSYGTPGPVAGYRYFAGGGGSGGGASPAPPGSPITNTGVMGRPGGVGGGGTGGDVNWTGIYSSPYPTATATPGTTNTGGGGGGGGGGYVQSGGTGGAGIVIIQYPE